MLIVEDDHDLRDSLQRYLTRAGLDVRGIADARSLVRELEAEPADVVVLDVNLPGGVDGFEAARLVRAHSTAAIVMLTGRSMRDDRLHGLSVGADHYIVKPVDPAELELVVRNLRQWVRAPEPPAAAGGAAPKGWAFDPTHWTLAAPTGAAVALSAVEHRLIDRLVAEAGVAVARADLVAELNRKVEDASSRSLDLVVFRLRRKVERACGCSLPVLSARGIGYVFAGPVVTTGR